VIFDGALRKGKRLLCGKRQEAEWVKWPGTIFGASALDE
jgi:hypothetical protein